MSKIRMSKIFSSTGGPTPRPPSPCCYRSLWPGKIVSPRASGRVDKKNFCTFPSHLPLLFPRTNLGAFRLLEKFLPGLRLHAISYRTQIRIREDEEEILRPTNQLLTRTTPGEILKVSSHFWGWIWGWRWCGWREVDIWRWSSIVLSILELHLDGNRFFISFISCSHNVFPCFPVLIFFLSDAA